MSRITRYVLCELLKVFVVGLVSMTVFLLLVLVAKEAVRRGLGPLAILQLLPFALPSALLFSVPGTILFAACVVYGRISAANEIVAIKSIGISPLVVIWPGLALAALISLGAVWLNDVAYSWGKIGVHRVVLQSIEQIAYGTLRTQRSYKSERFSIDVKAVEGRRLILPTLSIRPSNDSAAITLTADEAELRFNPEKNSLSFIMYNSEGEIGDSLAWYVPDEAEHELPLTLGDGNGPGPSEIHMRDIPQELRRRRALQTDLEEECAARSAYALMTGDFEQLGDPVWQARQMAMKQNVAMQHRLRAEPWRRWANGFSCLAFVLVGAPLAIRLRSSDFWTSFGICFLPILFVYYPLLMYGVDRAKNGELPEWSVWCGNLILGAVGWWLTRHVERH